MALRSDRLALRRLDVGDATFVESLYANAHVTRSLLRIQGPISIDEAREFCRAAAWGDYRFGASLRTGGNLIALGGVRRHADRPGIATIGYSVLPAFWGQGFGTELAALLIEFATDALGATEVRATTLDDNPASARVLEKLGFGVLEVGATEVDARGDERRVTRWVIHRRSAERSGAAGSQALAALRCREPEELMSEENKGLVREITEIIWNRRDLDRIPEFYAPDFVGDYRPYALREGHEGVRAMVEGAWIAFPDYHEEVHELIAEGDRVVLHLTISGTQRGQWGPLPATGKRAQFDEIVILQIRDGKVVRQRGIVDNLSALRQLGVVPSPRS